MRYAVGRASILGVTLNANARAENWFKASFMESEGWISASYIQTDDGF